MVSFITVQCGLYIISYVWQCHLLLCNVGYIYSAMSDSVICGCAMWAMSGGAIDYCAMWAINIELCLAVSFVALQCGLGLAVSFITVQCGIYILSYVWQCHFFCCCAMWAVSGSFILWYNVNYFWQYHLIL